MLLAHNAAVGEERYMQSPLQGDSEAIEFENKHYRAAKCAKCGAKMYPQSLLKPHLTRHQKKQRWFMTELRKLQYTLAHMRDIA
jgi:hypothetical protein